jgi:hypothetical protein
MCPGWRSTATVAAALTALTSCGSSPTPGPPPADARVADTAEQPSDRVPDRQAADGTAVDRAPFEVPLATDARTDSRFNGPTSCAELTGGALITFQVCGDLFTLWITRRPFLEEARHVLATGRSRIPIFSLVDGQHCDPRWTWHVDPDTAVFVDASTELCQGCPAFLERDKAYWINKVKNYCPTTVAVIQVDDRR